LAHHERKLDLNLWTVNAPVSTCLSAVINVTYAAASISGPHHGGPGFDIPA
jgi:hypothetical protein